MREPAESQEVVSVDLERAYHSDAWLTYGHDYTNQRYSPAKQITPANVASLVPVFISQTGTSAPIEASPIYSNGVLYLAAADDEVIAISAETGRAIWKYQPIVLATRLCCGRNSRGLAIADGMVFLGRLDGRLDAIDQYSGELVWSTQVANNREGYSITMAPLAYKGRIIVGVAGGEFGIRGFIAAFDIGTGHQIWKWYSTDPLHWEGRYQSRAMDGSDVHRDIKAERSSAKRFSDSWKRGGGPVWTTPAIDVENDTVIATTGNPWPDYLPTARPGDNLYTNCIVAIGAGDGKLRWYFQEVPHDEWDLDAASPPVLFDTTGNPGHLVGEAGKTGWFYVLDRDNGRFVRRSEPFVPQINMFSRIPGVEIQPGPGGGSNWSPVSYDPNLHFAMIMGTSRATIFHQPLKLARKRHRSERFATFTAVDILSGGIKWQRRIPIGSLGGSSSAFGVTYYGDSEGYFNAVETRTGNLLWRFQTGAGVNAAPIIFSYKDREYVSVAAGGAFRDKNSLGDSLVTFALPEKFEGSEVR